MPIRAYFLSILLSMLVPSVLSSGCAPPTPGDASAAGGDAGHAPPEGCGDGTIGPGEACDGERLGGFDCASFGHAGGTLACHASCTGFDTSGCSAAPPPPPVDPPPAPPEGPGPGDLVITELLRDPTAVPDAYGEWFEVHNPTDRPLELEGLTLHDDGSDAFVIDASLVALPGAYIVFGRSDTGPANGGVKVDWSYGASLTLANGEDELEIRNGATTIDRIAWAEAVLPNVPGAALALDPASTTAAANDAASAWCNATSAFNATDLGTPGFANGACP